MRQSRDVLEDAGCIALKPAFELDDGHQAQASSTDESKLGYLTDDEPPELAFYCSECAERQFGGD